jgi:hypothetical protein
VGAEATNNNTFVWSDGTTYIGSTDEKQFIVYSSNGIRLLGGPITGDGSLITNVNAATIGGVALAGLVRTNAALDALRLNNGSGLTNLNLVGSGGSTNIQGGGTWTLNAGTWTFAPTGSTTEVQSALDGKLDTNGVAQSSVTASNALTYTGTNYFAYVNSSNYVWTTYADTLLSNLWLITVINGTSVNTNTLPNR